MKKIYIPMIRFGDKEFDEGFIGWGFQSLDEQLGDAQGVLNLIRKDHLKILDVACGLGTYHRLWLNKGHTVVGTDISETFITLASSNNSNATYRVENYYDLAEENEYDLVTLIDNPIEDEELPRNAYRALKPGGHFVFQVPNPDYDHARGSALVNRRTWKENEDRTFLLTRNEYNEDVDRWEYEEWHIDLEKAEVIVQHNFSRNLTFPRIVDIVQSVGFATVSFLDSDGRPYEQGHEEIKNYFCVAYKGENGEG